MERYLLIFACYLPLVVSAAGFKTGPVLVEFGKHVAVEGVMFDENQKFKVLFDVAKGADAGEQNRYINSLARFINMHVSSGVAQSNIQLALVVHGSATLDLLSNKAYAKRKDAINGNLALLNTLMETGVKIYVCGQSAAAHGIDKDEFIPGVEVALSAMTANALLQQQGFTLNP